MKTTKESGYFDVVDALINFVMIALVAFVIFLLGNALHQSVKKDREKAQQQAETTKVDGVKTYTLNLQHGDKFISAVDIHNVLEVTTRPRNSMDGLPTTFTVTSYRSSDNKMVMEKYTIVEN